MNFEQMKEEASKHSHLSAEYIAEHLNAYGEDRVEISRTIILIGTAFTESNYSIPPDKITAKALRLMADSIDYADEQLGKTPDYCEYLRKKGSNALEGVFNNPIIEKHNNRLKNLTETKSNNSAWEE